MFLTRSMQWEQWFLTRAIMRSLWSCSTLRTAWIGPSRPLLKVRLIPQHCFTYTCNIHNRTDAGLVARIVNEQLMMPWKAKLILDSSWLAWASVCLRVHACGFGFFCFFMGPSTHGHTRVEFASGILTKVLVMASQHSFGLLVLPTHPKQLSWSFIKSWSNGLGK